MRTGWGCVFWCGILVREVSVVQTAARGYEAGSVIAQANGQDQVTVCNRGNPD